MWIILLSLLAFNSKSQGPCLWSYSWGLIHGTIQKKKASKSMAFTFYSTQHQSLFYKLSWVFPKPQTQANRISEMLQDLQDSLNGPSTRIFISFNKYLWNTLCMLDTSPRDKKGNNNKVAVLPEKAAWRNANRKRDNGKTVWLAPKKTASRTLITYWPEIH